MRRTYSKHQLAHTNDAKASGKQTFNAAHQFLMVHLVLVLHRVDFLASGLDAQSHLHADTEKEKVKARK